MDKMLPLISEVSKENTKITSDDNKDNEGKRGDPKKKKVTVNQEKYHNLLKKIAVLA